MMCKMNYPDFYNKIKYKGMTGLKLFVNIENVDCADLNYTKLNDILNKNVFDKSDLVKGIDTLGRNFVCLKCNYKYYDEIEWKNCILIFYQIYVKNEEIWIIRGNPVCISGGCSENMDVGDKWIKLNKLLNDGYLDDSLIKFLLF